MIAVPILLSKEMSNVFNRMLSALSVVDSVFIVCSILEAIRKHIGTLFKCISLHKHSRGILLLNYKYSFTALFSHFLVGSTKAHQYLFGYFLYQFHNMVLCASTYITVVLALERYKAVWRPVEYRNSVLSGDPWCRVFTYVAPVIVLSVLFNVPKVAHEKYFPRHINFY